ncbi:MAG: hypothetical protein RXN91_06980 [Caldivirga sp.]
MTEDTGETQVNKPEPKVTRELLGKPTQPTGCAAGATGGVTEVQARAVDVAKPQQTTVPGLAQSLEVDCRYCGGCCGGRRRGLRLPAGVVELIRRVKVLLGLRYECEVINRFPELFCRRLGRRGHGLNRIKELERLLSREGQYKGSYLVKRFLECSSDSACVLYLRLMVNGWLGLWFYVAGRGDVGEDDVDAYVGNIARYLGFRSVVDLAKYLRLIIQGLLIVRQTDRHAGYRDVLEVDCKMCGASFKTTDPLPSFIVKLVTHFKREHGLETISDVEEEVKEVEGVSDFDVLRRGKRYFDGLMSELADAFSRLGWIKDGRCMLCKGELKSDPYHVVLHFAGWHSEQVKQLLSGIAPQVGEQPSVEKVLEDAAREVSQRLGIEFELADGAIKSIYYIVNSRVRGAWGIDLVIKELGDVDPGLADKLKESGRDIRQVALAVVEVLRARSLIDEKHTTGESQVNSDKQSSMGQGNAQHQQSQAPTQVHEAKGQLSLKAFMPQEGSKQASKQTENKSAGGGVDVSEILRPEVVLKPINDPEALRRAVREFFEPWIIEEPDPRWLRVKRKYTMKLVEAVDKARSIEELNEMIARIEEEESKELAQLEKELKKQNAKH